MGGETVQNLTWRETGLKVDGVDRLLLVVSLTGRLTELREERGGYTQNNKHTRN